MKSPFPGVDPYLEQRWGDIHTSLMVYIRDQIDEQLPGDLQARVEESIAIDLDETTRRIYPDIKISDRPWEPTSGSTAVLDEPVADPILIPVHDDPRTMRHIEIVDVNSGHRVVTAIELLSPANKTAEAARQAYYVKQDEYLAGGVNLVEIDLIRAGGFIVAAPVEQIAWDRRTPYIMCIRRANQPKLAEIVPVSLRLPVPPIRIPLRPTDKDVILRLQPLLDECYRRGRYGSLDYTQPPRPNLEEQDAEWAEQLLIKSGRRKPGKS